MPFALISFVLLFLSLAMPVQAQSIVLEDSLHVQVRGLVKHPGLYRLYVGAREADAIQAAGGIMPGADLGSLDLASDLHDGDTLTVPAHAAPASPDVPTSHHRRRRRRGRSSAKLEFGQAQLDLNLATVAQLVALPGIGPSLAGDIVAYRRAHGRFHSLDELQEVPGIGDRRLARLKPFLKL